MILHFQGRDLRVNNTGLSPASSNMLLCISLHSREIHTAEKYTAACFPSKNTHSTHSKTAHS
ncbi:unnamed protein product [Staurois parvus]|uniref:Uncharacterized protein n=1 Tax=Staurois parvus TaxID=386267 RepID=A0ABN9CLH1_9NEOB|nr:unnamed protein product [Staurois parvus]